MIIKRRSCSIGKQARNGGPEMVMLSLCLHQTAWRAMYFGEHMSKNQTKVSLFKLICGIGNELICDIMHQKDSSVLIQPILNFKIQLLSISVRIKGRNANYQSCSVDLMLTTSTHCPSYVCPVQYLFLGQFAKKMQFEQPKGR